MKFCIRVSSLFSLLIFQSLSAQNDCVRRKEHFKADISYLSSDALEGRVTGSPGEKLSAEYIAKSFAEAGLKPLKGQTFQTFEIVKLRIATNACDLSMSVGENRNVHMSLFTDYYPLSPTGNNDSCTAELADCGYGLFSDSLKRDDFSPLGDIKGKIFIIRMGYPGDYEDSTSPLAAIADIDSKVQAAMKFHPAGILFVPGSEKAGSPSGELKRNASTYGIPIFYMKREINALPMVKMTMKSVIAMPKATGHNVLGYRNNKKKNTVVICAHHDHLGYNEYGGSRYTGPQAIHNGADDNASGVAAMLELARTLKGRKYKKNNYLFMAFSGEELGLVGSKFFTRNPLVDLKKINYVVNIDMLGRLDSQRRTMTVYGTGTSPAWKGALTALRTDTSRIKINTEESGLGPSDHASFYLENIPVLHFFTGQHEDYHKPSDDEYKINYEGMCNAWDVMLQMIVAGNKAGKLTFTKTKDVQQGRSQFKVSMGVMPDYTFEGKGMRLDGVSAGKPAEAAGLLRGDIITKMGEHEVGSVRDYMSALGKFNKGQKIVVTFLRGGETLTREVQL
ncbi:MAG: M20/M25/M40 family metallo-hydrolase [Bacteroidetes bacterium]|nr:M20/M25/M40 family metallo-hydrolase [Bacteroidota bacterium]